MRDTSPPLSSGSVCRHVTVRLATPEGQELEQNARGPSLAMANRQERSALASAGQEMYQDRRQLPAATGPAAPYVQAAAQARTANLNAPPYTQAGPTASNAAQDMLYQQMRGQPVDITNTINMGRNIARSEVGTGRGPACWTSTSTRLRRARREDQTAS